MAVTLVLGSQWGDEGKGKILDVLSSTADFVLRFHGGNNAGHTVKNSFGTFAMHLVPSGIFGTTAKACITAGTVLDLEVLLSEIEALAQAGIPLAGRLFISPRCHVIMPYHKIFDRLYEELKGKHKVGTTGRGIGPVYADKVSYNGIQVADLLNKQQFSHKLEIQLAVKNKILTALGEKELNHADMLTTYLRLSKKLTPYINEPYPLIHAALRNKQEILLEGAHGMFLDPDWGTYPFVTASNVVAGNITAGAGIPPRAVTRIIGVVKAYTTRVGAGPFPTELLAATGEALRAAGAEFGTTTGRPRRCGWFDAELVRFAAEINGFTELALTKLDVLDNFATLKVCTGYTYKGKQVRYPDGNAAFLAHVKPIYQIVPGWRKSTQGVTEFKKLPQAAQNYVHLLEKLIGVPVRFISTGKGREEIITR